MNIPLPTLIRDLGSDLDQTERPDFVELGMLTNWLIAVTIYYTVKAKKQ